MAKPGRTSSVSSSWPGATCDLSPVCPATVSLVTTPAAMSDLFSDAVAVVETRAETVDESALWPEERHALGQVVAGRWWDWVMGRRCAREALTELGVDPSPILSGSKREPLWPAEVVGAITHTRGFAAAAVARSHETAGIGLDAEPDEPLPDGVLRRIASEAEQRWIVECQSSVIGVAHPDRLVFSAKESVYKVWYPIARAWLGFDDAHIDFDVAERRFEARISRDGPLTTLKGTYTSVDGVIMTAIELPAV